MFYVVKLGRSYRCDIARLPVPQWWRREDAAHYQTLAEAEEARREMCPSVPCDPQRARPHRGSCDCDGCYIPRVVRVRSREERKRERDAGRALAEAVRCVRLLAPGVVRKALAAYDAAVSAGGDEGGG